MEQCTGIGSAGPSGKTGKTRAQRNTRETRNTQGMGWKALRVSIPEAPLQQVQLEVRMFVARLAEPMTLRAGCRRNWARCAASRETVCLALSDPLRYE